MPTSAAGRNCGIDDVARPLTVRTTLPVFEAERAKQIRQETIDIRQDALVRVLQEIAEMAEGWRP
jgi:hypothetical protein